jgi:pimeloyl-ACP methyl ester carboxylesterase
VCSYDRAGYGSSEPGPKPRTAERIAGELELLLRNARINGPIILCHSAGLAALGQVETSPDRDRGPKYLKYLES